MDTLEDQKEAQKLQGPSPVADIFDLVGFTGLRCLKEVLEVRLAKYVGGTLLEDRDQLERLLNGGKRYAIFVIFFYCSTFITFVWSLLPDI